MPLRQERCQRRSIRLPGYDYSSPGAYFVTICVREGECLLGDVVGAEMRLNEFGRIAQEFWAGVPGHFPALPALRVAAVKNQKTHAGSDRRLLPVQDQQVD